VALYAQTGGKAAMAAASQPGDMTATARAAPEGVASAAEPSPEAADSGQGHAAGWWLAGMAALLALGVAVMRLWWRRPLALDALELEPSLEGAPPVEAADSQAAAAEDERRADAVAASLYTEDLEAPASAPAVEGDEPEPIALSATDPAVAAHLAKSLAEAYEELDRPQAAKTWRARGDEALPSGQ